MNNFEQQDFNRENADKQIILTKIWEIAQVILNKKETVGTTITTPDEKKLNITFSQGSEENNNPNVNIIVSEIENRVAAGSTDSVYTITLSEGKFKVDKIERDISPIKSRWEQLLDEPTPLPPKGLKQNFDPKKAKKLKEDINDTIEFTESSKISADMQKELGLNPISHEELKRLLELVNAASKLIDS